MEQQHALSLEWKKGYIGAVAIYANLVKITACFSTLPLTYSFNDSHQPSYVTQMHFTAAATNWNKFPASFKWAYPGYVSRSDNLPAMVSLNIIYLLYWPQSEWLRLCMFQDNFPALDVTMFKRDIHAILDSAF